MIWLAFTMSAILLAPATRFEKLSRILILEERRADETNELARYVTDADAGVRRRAVLAAGRIGASEHMVSMFGVLNDRKVEMRRMAVFSLGLFGERGAEQRLVMALNDGDPVVRGRAAEALARLGARSQAIEIARMVLKALPEGAPKVTVRGDDPGNPDDPWVELRLGLFALARLGDDEAAARVLLKDGQPRFDWWAATYVAARIASPSLKPCLSMAARSSDPLSRYYAARGLEALADPYTLDQIEELVADRNAAVAAQAVRALSRFSSVRAVSIAAKALESSDPGIVEEALAALARLPTSSGMLSQIAAHVGHSDPGVRAAALRALAHTDRERLALVLSGLDPDPVWSVHIALAESLGEIGDEISLGILHAMLADSEPYVLPAVLDAISRSEDGGASVIFRRYVDHPDFAVRAAAIKGLAKVGDPQNVEVLLSSYQRALGDAEPDARLTALSAIAEQCGEAGEAVLLNASRSDPVQGVRRHARYLLNARGQHVPQIAPQASVHPYLDYRQWMAPYTPRPDTPLYTPRALIHTRKGTIEIHFNILEAPLACASFMRLARRGFYNGLVFNAVVPGEIVYSGCPRGDGRGSAGFVLPSEPGLRPFGRGAMGLAETQRDTGGSRFFITLTPAPERDGENTLIGWVANGIEIVDRLRPGDEISWIEIWDGR